MRTDEHSHVNAANVGVEPMRYPAWLTTEVRQKFFVIAVLPSPSLPIPFTRFVK